jgi:hypothetical protein
MAKKRPPKKEKPLETLSNIRNIKAEISSMERMLEADQRSARSKIQDPQKIKEDIETKKKFLHEVTPKKLKGKAADKAYKRIEHLQEVIKKEMLPEKAFHTQYPKASDGHLKKQEFERAVKQQIKFQTDPVIKKAVNEYKSLMRQIDPQDPDAPNIENVRGMSCKPFFLSEQGKRNFDEINWSTEY